MEKGDVKGCSHLVKNPRATEDTHIDRTKKQPQAINETRSMIDPDLAGLKRAEERCDQAPLTFDGVFVTPSRNVLALIGL
jgi:hypothetical protein